MTISVLGAGAWGTALASSLAVHHDAVTLWGRDETVLSEISERRRNSTYLGDIAISSKLKISSDLEEACQASIVLCVTPAQAFSQLMDTIVACLPADSRIVLCAKGIDRSSGLLLHEVAERHVDRDRIAALSGPSFASDVARGLPTAVSLAAHRLPVAEDLASTLASSWFRIYASDDLRGLEVGGALKNVLALAVGCVRGLGLGASAEAALIARGFAELLRVGTALGGRSETLSGLSGLGDLVLTCSSPQSRNFAYGMALANGDNLDGLPLAEGVLSAAMALKVARENDVEVPIVETVVQVLEKTVTPRQAVSLLLERPLRTE